MASSFQISPKELCEGYIVKHSRFTSVATAVVCASLSAACVAFVSCKSDPSGTIQPPSDQPAAVAQGKAPLLDSSDAALRLVMKELDDGEIRLTPYARSMGLRGGSGMTGLPVGTPGEHCDLSGCIAAPCPSKDESGVTIMLDDVNGRPYNLGYCVNRYTGEVNAYNDDAFSLTMKGNHSAWKPF
jgi:hypothetical protein